MHKGFSILYPILAYAMLVALTHPNSRTPLFVDGNVTVKNEQLCVNSNKLKAWD